VTEPNSSDPKKQLRRAMGPWDLLLFNVASVLGPRWIAVAAHNGTSSISLWIIAATLFFLPTTIILTELSTRFPEEGGLYVWTKKAFGEFHGFVAGWTYWVYTVFYFPGLLMASVAMCAYVGGAGAASGTSGLPPPSEKRAITGTVLPENSAERLRADASVVPTKSPAAHVPLMWLRRCPG